jgi:hypothetical protein
MTRSQIPHSGDTCESRVVPTCARGHFLTADNIQRIGKAGTRCKICRRRISRENMRRKSGYYLRREGPPATDIAQTPSPYRSDLG